MIFPNQPEQVYVIGAAGFWLKRWPVSNADRKRRILAAFDRKFMERIERERRRIELIERAVNRLVN